MTAMPTTAPFSRPCFHAPASQMLVMTLIRSIPMLVDVLMLALFYFVVFGVTTIQLYAGKLSGRCGVPDFSNSTMDAAGGLQGVSYLVPGDQQELVCSGPDTGGLVWSNATGVPLPVSGIETNGGQGHICEWTSGPPDFASAAPFGYWCAGWGNPGPGGERNFDNFALALLAIFQTITLSDWSEIMYNCQVSQVGAARLATCASATLAHPEIICCVRWHPCAGRHFVVGVAAARQHGHPGHVLRAVPGAGRAVPLLRQGPGST